MASPKWLWKNEHLPTRSSLISLDENLCYPFKVPVKAQQAPLIERQLGYQGKLCTLQSTVPTASSTGYTVYHPKGQVCILTKMLSLRSTPHVASFRQWGNDSAAAIILNQQNVLRNSLLFHFSFFPLSFLLVLLLAPLMPYYFIRSNSGFTADISWLILFGFLFFFNQPSLSLMSKGTAAAVWNWTLLPPPTLDPQQSWNVINEMRWDSPECPQGQWEPAVVTKVYDFNASW